jgi:diadenylate cyclase
MSPFVSLALQALILGTGIYLALGFLRSTRGGGIVRGLVVALLFGAVGLWGLTELLRLEELSHILQSITGYVVVILVILFQPELRRGIAQLGEHGLLGQRKRQETASELVAAATSMAKRRRGALIAIERDSSLDAYVDNAVRVDGQVTRPLIESLFHPGAALHDGAVVVRGDRVAAAACLFPLTENLRISSSTGTRHRAALGLTEETDAVTLVVSEETGEIALCRGGEMQSNVSPERLEGVLRELLGREATTGSAPTRGDGPSGLFAGLFTQNLGRKAAAAGLACGLLFLAHRDIHVAREFTLQIVSRSNGTAHPARPGELVLHLPSPDYKLASPRHGEVYKVTVSGTRAQVENLGSLLSGELAVPPELAGTSADVDLSQVSWNEGVWSGTVGLNAQWTQRPGPHLLVERMGRRTFTLRPEHLRVDASALDPRFRPDIENARFQPTELTVVGPEGSIRLLDGEGTPLSLAPIVLSKEDTGYGRGRVGLGTELEQRRFTVAGKITVQVTVPIVDALQPLGVLEKKVQLVALESRDAGTQPWALSPAAVHARFSLRGVGVMPEELEPDSPEWQARLAAVQAFVHSRLRVFVDTTDVEEPGSREVEVRWLLEEGWQQSLADEIGGMDERTHLELVLESASRLLLLDGKSAESRRPPAGGEDAARTRTEDRAPGGRD